MRKSFFDQRFVGSRATTKLALVACVALAAAASSGCSDLTSVNTLDVAEMGQMENRTGARTLRAGAISAFAGSFAGSFSSQAVVAARVSDEFTYTNPATGSDAYAHRNMSETHAGGFALISQARAALLDAIRMMERFDAESIADIAELHSLVAYTHLFYGENWCSGVPISEIVDGQVVFGEQLTTEQILELAVDRFQTAANVAGTSERSLHLARIGQARALLHLGRFADAAAAAADVPTGFEYRTSHGPPQQQNNLSHWTHTARSYTIAEREGSNGLDFVSANDPRVQTRLLPDPGIDGQTPVYAPEKHPTVETPVVLASGVEARLIEAEALLDSGDAEGALARLNDLRTGVDGLEPLGLEPTAAERVDQLFRERAFWLFLTGHRFGDMRRLVRQYGRSAESVFPTGSFAPGREYGSAVTLGLPSSEAVNPLFTGGCFNRDA